MLDFGDNTSTVLAEENLSRSSPDQLDFHTFTHKYRYPGLYTPSISVQNHFGEILLNLSHPIIVQNSLTGGEFQLVSNQVDTVAYPPGFLVLNAELKSSLHEIQNCSNRVWANNVSITWLDDNKNIIFQNQAPYETGNFI